MIYACGISCLHQGTKFHLLPRLFFGGITLQLCEEYSLALEQLATAERNAITASFRSTALEALNRASPLFGACESSLIPAQYLIGLAFFHLHLRDDLDAARYWFSQFHQQKIALDHYALWVRDRYNYVRSRLQLNDHSFN